MYRSRVTILVPPKLHSFSLLREAMIAGIEPRVDLADQEMAVTNLINPLAARNLASISAPAGSVAMPGAGNHFRPSIGIRSGVVRGEQPCCLDQKVGQFPTHDDDRGG